MILNLKMIAFLSVLLCVVIIRGTHGTFFPEVKDPPQIHSTGLRGLSNPPQDFYAREDLPQVKDERFVPPGEKPDEERWYYEDNLSREISNRQSSFDTFERYYESGEPAISHVATPIPDEVRYLDQYPSIPKTNPTDDRNPGIFILARDNSGQNNPQRWVQLQLPPERLVQDVNQDSSIPVATDTVKSIVAPVPFDIPRRTQLPGNQAVNIVQVRQSKIPELQNVYTNFPRTVGNVPAEKQIVGIPQPQINSKTVVQQQVIDNGSPAVLPLSPPIQISAKNSFEVPPPLPPPLKGGNVPANIISSVPVNIISDSNAVVSSKNINPDLNTIPSKSVVQQLRHVWIPTSSKTGKFITIPISGAINSGKSSADKQFSLDSLPVTVSDTWVLRQDGRVPVFEQQKSAPSPALSPIFQSGKVIFQNPTIVQVDGPPNTVTGKGNLPKNPALVEETLASSVPVDIWPIRKELASPETLGGYSPIFASDALPAPVKSDSIIIRNPALEIFSAPQKSIVSTTKSALPPPIPSPTVQIVNGKPCPLPIPAPPKSLVSPLNAGIISDPKISSQRSLPFARIIRVSRYPTGSYYLLNKNLRPNYFVYPSQAALQQPKAGLIRIVQTKQLPSYSQRKIPLPFVQTKQISVPVQSRQISSPKQITYPFVSRQVILPVVPPKTNRVIYPTVQAIRYSYPWNAYRSPILGKGVYLPELSPFKAAGSESDSSSSESSSESSSSEEDSSESSKGKKEGKSKKEKSKEEKSKKEKIKKEEESKSSEKDSSSKSERETESKSKDVSKESSSSENSTEKKSEESLEASESKSSS